MAFRFENYLIIFSDFQLNFSQQLVRRASTLQLLSSTGHAMVGTLLDIR